MTILVLSDSHSGLRFMRSCIDAVKPDHVVHLGDLYEDAQAMAEENPGIRFHMVPGNCDSWRLSSEEPCVLCYSIDGVKLFMTHGHLHGVKSGLSRLLADARSNGAQGVLFGHTHEKLCLREPDGLWVLNPGTCRSDHGSAGVIKTQDNQISACYLLEQTDIGL